jgi:dissimilatory sulfite reductase related protein
MLKASHCNRTPFMRTLPETPSLLVVNGRKILLDEQGFLIEPDDWNDHVAEELARRAGVTLTEAHWEVIHYMRVYLAENGIAADARFVFRLLDAKTADGKSGRALFFELFPYGYVGQACKIAGMRQPRAWSTG